MSYIWLSITNTDLETELLQAEQEGIVLDPIAQEFKFLLTQDLTLEKNQRIAQQWLDRLQNCPKKHDYPYNEPDDLEQIHAITQSSYQKVQTISKFEDKVRAGWSGRCAGCLLGKPVEGWMRNKITDYLKHTGQWPLTKYITKSSDQKIENQYQLVNIGSFVNEIDCMPEDDDINYTVSNLAIYEKHGPKFNSLDIADFWLMHIPILRTCTAERVAYKNIINGIKPPQSATHRNPYREWIGAQIRADFWGYIAAGDPRTAAEYAWRDARVSHVKNGIYGEMLMAAIIAAAFVEDQPETAVQQGLNHIPRTSRLYEAIQKQLQSCRHGTFDDSIEDLHKRWDQCRPHDWCHVIPNAEIVVISLLHGNGDFTKSICMATEAGFDTDCNAATVGSILGAMYGTEAIPAHWTEPLRSIVKTGVVGFEQITLDDLVSKTISAKYEKGGA